jgi:hypothetical protein
MIEVMQLSFHKGGILWAVLISPLVILGEYAPVIRPPLQMGNARPIHFSNVSFFKTNELTKPPIRILDAPLTKLWIHISMFPIHPGQGE